MERTKRPEVSWSGRSDTGQQARERLIVIKKVLAAGAVAAPIAGISATPAPQAMGIGNDTGTTSVNGSGSSQSFGNSETRGDRSPQFGLVQGSLNKPCVGIAGQGRRRFAHAASFRWRSRTSTSCPRPGTSSAPRTPPRPRVASGCRTSWTAFRCSRATAPATAESAEPRVRARRGSSLSEARACCCLSVSRCDGKSNDPRGCAEQRMLHHSGGFSRIFFLGSFAQGLKSLRIVVAELRAFRTALVRHESRGRSGLRQRKG